MREDETYRGKCRRLMRDAELALARTQDAIDAYNVAILDLGEHLPDLREMLSKVRDIRIDGAKQLVKCIADLRPHTL